ncbi:MAG: DUF3854 domain-containing protein [Defluviitaleaceae bacterium]|nr:DUF3854 domain-containing protein [Defluviitaleaceae bacterium]
MAEAFDMDKYTNLHVAKAVENLKEKAITHGIEMKSVTWENKDLKGIDDYFLWRWQQKQKAVYDISGSVAV